MLNPTPKMKNQTRERVEAMRQKIRTKRDVKKTIDKGVLPSAVVEVDFTPRGNLTLHIKNLNKTIEKFKPFGTPIDNETWVALITVKTLSKNQIDWVDGHKIFLFSEPNIPTYIRGKTVIKLVFASKEVRICDFLQSENMGSGYYLELWSLSAARTSRDGRIKPRLKFNTPGGSFNFKDVDWGQFSNLIAQGFMNLKLDVNKCRGKAKRHPNTETQTRAKECSEEFPTEMSEAKRKYWNGFLSSRNSSNIWDVPAYVKEKQLRTVVSQLTRKGDTTTKELTEIIDYFFQELIPLAPSSRSLCIPPIPMKDAR